MRSGETAWTAVLAVGLFALYAAGACPTIYVGDSGELVAAVHVLGIPHPTGYPLYVLLGKLWTLLLPLGSIAYRMSLFSAATGAAAAALLFQAGRILGLRRPVALTGALLFALAPSVWGEANVQRVYSLNALFVALATTTALRWWRRHSARWLVATLAICGLGATNHTFMALYAAAFTAAVGIAVLGRVRVEGPEALRRLGLVWGADAPLRIGVGKTVLAAAVAFAAGLLPYVYLPLRSRADPPLDWGDPETLTRWLDVVLRRGFWGRAWVESPGDVPIIAADYLRGIATEFTWVGAALVLLGIASARRYGWPVLLFVAVMLINVAVMTAHGSRSDLFIWHRYYIPSYAMAALLAACGIERAVARLPRAVAVAPLLLPAVLLVGGWREFDRSRYRIAEDFSRAVLASLPPGARLIATDDNILFVLIYLTMVESLRPDVQLILQGVGAADLPPLRFNPDTDPVYFTHHPNWQLAGLEIVPIGLVFEARRAGQPLPEPTIPLRELPGEHDPRVPKDYLTQNLVGQLHYMLGFTEERRDWQRAQREFSAAAAASPDNDVLFYNLGLIYERNGLLDEARRAYARSEAINPRHVASSSRARASDRLAAVAAEERRLAAIEATLAADSPLPAGSPAYHRSLAERLDAHGEAVAARGHRLRAEQANTGG
jgi:tetratricopeptide (TPR) repeat protein